MKKLFGIGFIIHGIVSFFIYLSIYGMHSLSQLVGVFIGLGLFPFLPGLLLIRSANKNKSNTDEK